MSQHDMDILDGNGTTVLADLNLALKALVSNNSGAAEPATPYALMLWADTTAGIMKQRNAANTGWLNRWLLATEQTFVSTITSSVGTLTAASGAGSYIMFGNLCHFNIDITITTNGTGAGAILFTLPFTHKVGKSSSFVGHEWVVSGKRLWGYILSNSASGVVVNVADGTYVGADGYVLSISGTFPIL